MERDQTMEDWARNLTRTTKPSAYHYSIAAVRACIKRTGLEDYDPTDAEIWQIIMDEVPSKIKGL